jgi:hypothetical protein
MKLGKRSTVLALVLALMLASASLVAAQTQVNVYIEPPSQVIYPGDQGTFEVWASDVADFYGAQFTLTFDDAVIQGVSVEPGSAFTDFPDEYEVAVATIVSDTVSFAATLLRVPKAGPLSGDIQLAVITFDALVEGTSPIEFGEVKLSDSSGAPISFSTTDGSVTVTEAPTILIGSAYMEGRSDHSGILVTLGVSPTMTTTTDISGTYTFEGVPSGAYTITMSADLYLSAMATHVGVVEGETNYACDVTLLGGDLNNDEIIDILDLATCAGHFETTDPEADVNADGIVDVYDLVLLGKNFKLEGPTAYFCGL